MKNKGVIIAIILILCAGVFVTNYTKSFISSGTASDMQEEAAEIFDESIENGFGTEQAAFDREQVRDEKQSKDRSQTKGGQEAAVALTEDGVGSPVYQEAAGLPDEPETLKVPSVSASPAALSNEEALSAENGSLLAPENEIPAEAEGDAAVSDISERATVVISPLTGCAEPEKKKEASSSLDSEGYKKKLNDIDTTIKKMKDSGIEPNPDSYKNMAEYEYRLWDNALNTIYQDIIGKMNEEQAQSLRDEEREWLRQRDQTAYKAISKHSGGTLESLEYTASMADSTRTRVYALLENYGNYLNYILVEVRERQ